MKPLTISILLISLILIPNSGYSLKHDIEGWGGLNWSDSMESAKNKIDAEYTQFEDENLKYLCWKKEIILKSRNPSSSASYPPRFHHFLQNKCPSYITHHPNS